MKTVEITLNSPGTSTGPFDLYSDIDSYTSEFDSNISRDSLISGYVSTFVPDSANIIRVKSTGICTNYTDITITSPTTTTTTSTTTTTTTSTTTTTLGCFAVEYGFDDINPSTACENYTLGSTIIMLWNGTTLFSNSIPSCTILAPDGYYSDGSDVWYWDGSTLSHDSECSSDAVLTFSVKRSGNVSSGFNSLDIMYSTDYGASWNSVASATSLTTSYVVKGSVTLPMGTPLYVGVRRNIAQTDIRFGIGISSYNYCGLVLPPYTEFSVDPGCYNYGTASLDQTIYINVQTASNNYVNCS